MWQVSIVWNLEHKNPSTISTVASFTNNICYMLLVNEATVEIVEGFFLNPP